MKNWEVSFIWTAFIIWSVSIYTSISLSALGHIILIPPSILALIRLIKSKNITLPKSYWALLALFGVSVLSVLFNWDIIEKPFRHLGKLKYFLMTLLIVLPVKELLAKKWDEKKVRLILHLFLISTAIAAISGIIGVHTGFNPLKMKNACHPTRSCGLYGMYMTYGYGISFFITILIGLLLKRKQVLPYAHPLLVLSSTLINFVGLIYSYTRGALLGLLISAPFYFFKNYKKKFILLMVSSVICLGVAIQYSPRLNDVFTKRSGSNLQRISYFKAAFYGLKERPILGLGFKNFEPNSVRLKTEHGLYAPNIQGHAHNNYLEVLASTGLLGLLSFVLFLGFWLVEVYRRGDLLGYVCFPFIINFMVSGMTQYTFGDGENLFFIFFVYILHACSFSKSAES